MYLKGNGAYQLTQHKKARHTRVREVVRGVLMHPGTPVHQLSCSVVNGLQRISFLSLTLFLNLHMPGTL